MRQFPGLSVPDKTWVGREGLHGGGPQRRRLARALCWDKNSRGSRRSGVSCQGWELRGGRGRATVAHVRTPKDCRPVPTQGNRAWLRSILTYTLSSFWPSSGNYLPALSLPALPPTNPARLGQGPLLGSRYPQASCHLSISASGLSPPGVCLSLTDSMAFVVLFAVVSQHLALGS